LERFGRFMAIRASATETGNKDKLCNKEASK
jgi:hypothetical protein